MPNHFQSVQSSIGMWHQRLQWVLRATDLSLAVIDRASNVVFEPVPLTLGQIQVERDFATNNVRITLDAYTAGDLVALRYPAGMIWATVLCDPAHALYTLLDGIDVVLMQLAPHAVTSLTIPARFPVKLTIETTEDLLMDLLL